MAALPTGTVSFLFTDIEGSTRIWEREPERMRGLLARHDEIVRRVVEKHGGHVFKTVGDAFCVAFHDPLEAADAAIETQQELLATFTEFRVRAGIYTGPAVETDGDYFGPAVNRVARLLSAGHGGQILVDGASAELIGEAHRDDTRLRLLGAHRLKDLTATEEVFQVLHPELPSTFPPLNTLDIAFRRGVVRAAAISAVVVVAVTALALVALDQARRADRNADLAIRGERRAIRGERLAVQNADTAKRESQRANREERAAKAASEQRRLALGVAVQARNKATRAAEEERRAKLRESVQKQIALYQKAQAGTQRDLALQQLIKFHVTNGDRFLESGGPLAALPWYQRVLEITRAAGKPERNARIRLAGILRRCPELRHVLPLQQGMVAAAYSPDGSLLATLSAFNRLVFWNLQKGRRIGSPRTLDQLSGGVAFSPDGKHVLTGMSSPLLGSFGGRLAVHSAEEGPVYTLEVPQPITGAFSPDGRRVLATSEQRFAALYDVSTGKQVGSRLEHPARVGAAEFLRGPDAVITACDDGNLRIWDLPSGRVVRTLRSTGPNVSILAVTPRHIVATSPGADLMIWDGDGSANQGSPARQVDTQMTSLDIDPKGEKVVVGDHSARSARVYDLRTGNPVALPLLHPAGIMGASFSPDGATVVTACDDGCARLWETRSGRLIDAPMRLSSPCVLAQFSPDGGSLATVSSDGVGRVWATKRPQAYQFSVQRAGTMSAGVYSEDGKWIVSTGFGQPALIYNAVTGHLRAKLAAGAAQWNGASVHAATGLLVTTGPRRSICLWDTRALRVASPLMEQTDPPARGVASEEDVVYTHALTADRRRLYTGFITAVGTEGEGDLDSIPRYEREVSAWDPSSGRQAPFPIPYPRPLRVAEFTADGRAVLLGGSDGAVRLYRLPDGAPLSPPFKPGSIPIHVNFSPDGRRVAFRSAGSSAEVWDARAGRRLGTLRHRETVFFVGFSPDSRSALTASADGTARVWSAETGRPITPPLTHPGGWAMRGAFSPDGTQVVTVGGVIGDRGEARLWDARTGEALCPPLEHPQTIRDAQFSPDGKRIVTVGMGGVLRVWDTAPESRPVRELAKLSAVLSGTRFAKDGTPEPLDASGLARLFTAASAVSRNP